MKRLFLLVFLGLFLIPSYALGASYGFSPASGTRSVGATFSVRVIVATNEAINAVSGEVVFNKSKLEVVSVSTAGSMVNIWVKQPTYSNVNGTVSFEGVVLNPGYTGASGTVLTITFRGIGSGVGDISLSRGSILANDGLGTNLIDGLATGAFTLTADTPPPPVVPTTPGNISTPLFVRSATHPLQDVWGSGTEAVFSWDVPEGIIGLRYDFDRSPTSLPVTEIAPTTSQLTIPLNAWPSDGQYYFHIQAKTAAGWGPVTHRGILADRTSPESFVVREVKQTSPTNPHVLLEFATTDTQSGIADYELELSHGSHELVATGARVTLADPGFHQIGVLARDRAGNVRRESFELYIAPLDEPAITTYQERIGWKFNSLLGGPIPAPVIQGTAAMGDSVRLVFTAPSGARFEREVPIMSDRTWSATYPELRAPGLAADARDGLGYESWEVRVQAVAKDGARSFLSDPKPIALHGPLWLLIAVSGGILLLLILGLALYLWRHHRHQGDVPVVFTQT